MPDYHFNSDGTDGNEQQAAYKGLEETEVDSHSLSLRQKHIYFFVGLVVCVTFIMSCGKRCSLDRDCSVFY